MLTFLGLIVAMILIGMFWRIILPVAVLGVLGIGAVILIGAGIVTYENSQVPEPKVAFTCPDPKWSSIAELADIPSQHELIVWQKKNCVHASEKGNESYTIVPVEGNPFAFKCPDTKNWDAVYPDYNPSKELVDWQKKNCSWTPNH